MESSSCHVGSPSSVLTTAMLLVRPLLHSELVESSTLSLRTSSCWVEEYDLRVDRLLENLRVSPCGCSLVGRLVLVTSISRDASTD